MELKTHEAINVKVIGTGGIGTCLLPPLCKLLQFGTADVFIEDVNVTLVDGDEYETKNEARQFFNNYGNKAESKKTELENDCPNLNFSAITEYITEENASEMIQSGDVVFMCVDNHNTRRLVSKHCSTLENVMLVSGGNNYHDGDIQVYRRINGKDLTSSLHNEEIYPEIANSEDEHPKDIPERSGCQEQVASAPQLILANNTAACLMLNAFYSFMNGVFDPESDEFVHVFDRSQFDTKTGGFKKFNYSNTNAVDIVNKKRIDAIKAKRKQKITN